MSNHRPDPLVSYTFNYFFPFPDESTSASPSQADTTDNADVPSIEDAIMYHNYRNGSNEENEQMAGNERQGSRERSSDVSRQNPREDTRGATMRAPSMEREQVPEVVGTRTIEYTTTNRNNRSRSNAINLRLSGERRQGTQNASREPQRGDLREISGDTTRDTSRRQLERCPSVECMQGLVEGSSRLVEDPVAESSRPREDARTSHGYQSQLNEDIQQLTRESSRRNTKPVSRDVSRDGSLEAQRKDQRGSPTKSPRSSVPRPETMHVPVLSTSNPEDIFDSVAYTPSSRRYTSPPLRRTSAHTSPPSDPIMSTAELEGSEFLEPTLRESAHLQDYALDSHRGRSPLANPSQRYIGYIRSSSESRLRENLARWKGIVQQRVPRMNFPDPAAYLSYPSSFIPNPASYLPDPASYLTYPSSYSPYPLSHPLSYSPHGSYPPSSPRREITTSRPSTSHALSPSRASPSRTSPSRTSPSHASPSHASPSRTSQYMERSDMRGDVCRDVRSDLEMSSLSIYSSVLTEEQQARAIKRREEEKEDWAEVQRHNEVMDSITFEPSIYSVPRPMSSFSERKEYKRESESGSVSVSGSGRMGGSGSARMSERGSGRMLGSGSARMPEDGSGSARMSGSGSRIGRLPAEVSKPQKDNSAKPQSSSNNRAISLSTLRSQSASGRMAGSENENMSSNRDERISTHESSAGSGTSSARGETSNENEDEGDKVQSSKEFSSSQQDDRP